MLQSGKSLSSVRCFRQSAAESAERRSGRPGAAMKERVDNVSEVIKKGKRQCREEVPGRPPRNDRVGPRGREPPHRLPSEPNKAKLRWPQLHLQPGQKQIFLVPNVLPEELDQSIQYLPMLDRVGLQRLQLLCQLVDLLMLKFHAQGEPMPVRQDAPDQRPEDRFLRVSVPEDQAIDFEERRTLFACLAAVEPVQELIQPDMITLLAAENAAAPAQLSNILLCE